MMDVIAGAFGGLKTAADLTQGLLALKTDAAVSGKAVELNRVIAEVQQQPFTAQANHAAQTSRIRELEAEVVNFKNWEQEKQRYQLHQLVPGTLVYRVKPDMQGTEPMHDICPNCYEQGVKSILQNGGLEKASEVVSCKHCKASFIARRIESVVQFSSSRSRSVWGDY